MSLILAVNLIPAYAEGAVIQTATDGQRVLIQNAFTLGYTVSFLGFVALGVNALRRVPTSKGS